MVRGVIFGVEFLIIVLDSVIFRHFQAQIEDCEFTIDFIKKLHAKKLSK